jgi:NADH:ubiquinone oxidoreductase subunit 5 (subunit L)/multisubunit Na+/H+ antiporter MnhA subunit
MVGALAVAVFVKLLSTVFLGSSRSTAADHAHDPPFAMKLPMIVIALFCILLGVYPLFAAPLLDAAVRSFAPLTVFDSTILQSIPSQWIFWMGALLILLTGAGALWIFVFSKLRKEKETRLTWDCGYAANSSRVQYTGASLGQTIVSLFSFALMPKHSKVKIMEAFPGSASFEQEVPDTILDRLVLPFFSRLNGILPKLYIFQQGQTYLYVLYVVIITALLFFLGISGVIK